MRTLQEEFSGIDIGNATQFRNLTLFPLLPRNQQTALDYLLLEDGIAQGKCGAVRLRAMGLDPLAPLAIAW